MLFHYIVPYYGQLNCQLKLKWKNIYTCIYSLHIKILEIINLKNTKTLWCEHTLQITLSFEHVYGIHSLHRPFASKLWSLWITYLTIFTLSLFVTEITWWSSWKQRHKKVKITGHSTPIYLIYLHFSSII